MKPIKLPIQRFNLAGRVRRRLVRSDLGPCLEVMIKQRGPFRARHGSINGMVAARVIVALTGGAVLTSHTMVCHHCDNPRCIRRAHLFIGSAFDNNSDRMRKDHAREGWSLPISLPTGIVSTRMCRLIRQAIPGSFSARFRLRDPGTLPMDR